MNQITKLKDNITSIEVDINATNVRLWKSIITKLSRQLEYYLNGKLNAIDLKESKYTFLGEFEEGKIIPYKICKEFEDYLDDKTIMK